MRSLSCNLRAEMIMILSPSYWQKKKFIKCSTVKIFHCIFNPPFPPMKVKEFEKKIRK